MSLALAQSIVPFLAMTCLLPMSRAWEPSEHPPLLKVDVKPFWDCRMGTSPGTENHTVPYYENAIMPHARPTVPPTGHQCPVLDVSVTMPVRAEDAPGQRPGQGHAQAKAAHRDQRGEEARFSTLSRGHVRDLAYSGTAAAQHQAIKRLVHDLDTGAWCVSSKTPGARLTSVLPVALGERCCGEGRIDAT